MSLLAVGAALSGCSSGVGPSHPLSTEDANPSSFRPLYDKTLAVLAEPSGPELPALRKLFPQEPESELENAISLCGNIDPGTFKLRLLNSLDPYHIMTGHLTGRKRHSLTDTSCGLALLLTSNSNPQGGRHWEIQAWSLRATSSPTPRPDE
ncbi:hypothetical protein [Humibacter ginsengisoli]